MYCNGWKPTRAWIDEPDDAPSPWDSYTLVPADEGKTVMVEMYIDDNAGNWHRVYSATTAVVSAPLGQNLNKRARQPGRWHQHRR